MVIDNFDIIREHLDFIDTKLDRYVVHVLRRPKDISEDLKNALGANESQRLIKTYYIDSLEYFDKKREAIKELCRANNARAYIIVQPKDNFECLLNLGEKIFETIRNKNYSVKPEHLIRQAYCEWHKTRKKQWILDLDNDEMHGWTQSQVKDLVAKQLEAIGKPSSEMYEVPTKHGVHIVSSPFNLMEAAAECPMMYEGVKKGNTLNDVFEELLLSKSKEEAIAAWNAHKLTPFNAVLWISDKVGGYDEAFRVRKRLEAKMKDIVGWLHKDGMTLLFLEQKDN